MWQRRPKTLPAIAFRRAAVKPRVLRDPQALHSAVNDEGLQNMTGALGPSQQAWYPTC